MKNSNFSSKTLSDNSHYILYNTANYNTSINNSVSDIIIKFVEIITEYMKNITEKITIKNNANNTI